MDGLIVGLGGIVGCAGSTGPRRGAELAEDSMLAGDSIAFVAGRIAAIGTQAELTQRYDELPRYEAAGALAIPGFVDPHTHCCYAGDRADEFVMRIGGATYTEIMAAGGGIMSTVTKTRAASLEELIAQTATRLDRMAAHGTTTVEIKTGYGLSTADELRMLEALAALEKQHPLRIVPTFLGAHAVPAEYRGRTEEYVMLVIEEMIPAVAAWWERQDAWRMPLGCDVFCEAGVFDVEQSRRILEAARQYGMITRLHVDEFEPLGGTPLAVELGAHSVDHLVSTPPEHLATLAGSQTIGVALPGTPFGLGHHEFTPARALIAAGGALALATDCNPGTSICESMPFIIALACRYLRLTPMEALHAATINSAHALGCAGDVGSLEVGKQADITLLSVPSVNHLGYRFGTNPVSAVFVGGRRIVG